jgi:heme-degrading monooxygenase HmoA
VGPYPAAPAGAKGTGIVTLITAFEVPPDADEPFVGAWRTARAAPGPAVLHRALRADVTFRFVEIARIGDADAEPPAPADPLATPAHLGRYRVAHEDGAPDGDEGVVLIDLFEVDRGQDERFLSDWRPVRDALAEQRGYLGSRLHRSTQDTTGFRYVGVTRWSSPLPFFRATNDPGYQAAATAMPFRSHPGIYQVIAP